MSLFSWSRGQNQQWCPCIDVAMKKAMLARGCLCECAISIYTSFDASQESWNSEYVILFVSIDNTKTKGVWWGTETGQEKEGSRRIRGGVS